MITLTYAAQARTPARGFPTTEPFQHELLTETFVRVFWVGVSLTTLRATFGAPPAADYPPCAEVFGLVHLATAGIGGGGTSAIIPLTGAGRPYTAPVGGEPGCPADYTCVDVAEAVELARDLQRLYVQRGLALAPPELWRAPEGVYFVFEQAILYAGVTPTFSAASEILRTAVEITGGGAYPSRRYYFAGMTTLGLTAPPQLPDVATMPRFASVGQRAISPDAQALQVLGQNKQKGDLLIREGQQILRLRASTGEIATVTVQPAAQSTAAASHPGDVQTNVGGAQLAATGRFAHALTRLTGGSMVGAGGDLTTDAFYRSPGQAVAVLDDQTDASEVMRGHGRTLTSGMNLPLTDASDYDSGRAIVQGKLPEGGGFRKLEYADETASTLAMDVVVGPQDMSRIDRSVNEATPFVDLLNVLLDGRV